MVIFSLKQAFTSHLMLANWYSWTVWFSRPVLATSTQPFSWSRFLCLVALKNSAQVLLFLQCFFGLSVLYLFQMFARANHKTLELPCKKHVASALVPSRTWIVQIMFLPKTVVHRAHHTFVDTKCYLYNNTHGTRKRALDACLYQTA